MGNNFSHQGLLIEIAKRFVDETLVVYNDSWDHLAEISYLGKKYV